MEEQMELMFVAPRRIDIIRYRAEQSKEFKEAKLDEYLKEILIDLDVAKRVKTHKMIERRI